jgi:hypothetical protein
MVMTRFNVLRVDDEVAMREQGFAQDGSFMVLINVSCD